MDFELKKALIKVYFSSIARSAVGKSVCFKKIYLQRLSTAGYMCCAGADDVGVTHANSAKFLFHLTNKTYL